MNIIFHSSGAEGIDYASETLAQRFLPDSDYRIISFKKHKLTPNFQKSTTIVGTRVPEYSQKIALEKVFSDYVKRQISINVTNP